ncbi:uncharacterized protein B0H18DRAFT_1124779 [Fomitopsis serialis]|uniref:uncharacterized protein n=1 Tax=Fomitopsis serialis TaxID=139415 RepID=UPI002007EEEB|nr:uncharacterized protein B0H18DRAFT_1124779 [Neoantrodia serialis]KAH9915640.1 hypothetical protein B0H18DRAFT_1124779 [Neoantrodia serialis]
MQPPSENLRKLYTLSSSLPPSLLASSAVFGMGVQKAVDAMRAQVKVEMGVKVEAEDALLLLD